MSDKRSTTEEPNADATGWKEWRVVPEKLSQLRRALYQKAKREPKFRFYALYDRIYRKDVLTAAWEQVRSNDGAPGIDGITIDQILDAEEGPARLIEEIHEALRNKSYVPQAVRRVYIPKANGGERPLGIPTVRDRVVQTAALLVLEPIFEADFLDCSHGFRPGRSTHDALGVVRAEIQAGRREVYDADLKGYFDSIPHEKLEAAVGKRIADRSVMRLIRLWLRVPVDDPREGGPPRRSSAGTPQGGVISPLLSNAFLHWFDKLFQRADGPSHWAGAKLVRYADDFVVLARFQSARLTEWLENVLEVRMGLVINREKTRVVDLKRVGASLDFLGYTFRYDRDLRGRSTRYLNVVPSKKALARERATLRRLTSPQTSHVPIPQLLGDINRHLAGWANAFRFGYPRVAMRKINWYTCERLGTHLRRRSQRPFRPPKGRSLYEHLKVLGWEPM